MGWPRLEVEDDEFDMALSGSNYHKRFVGMAHRPTWPCLVYILINISIHVN
jgi:hypothetical protein